MSSAPGDSMVTQPAKTVVFGGAGFIGGHLLRALIADGCTDLVAIDVKAPQQPVAGVTYVQADVRDLSGLSIDGPIVRIYDLAALCVIPKYEVHEYYDVNVSGAASVTAFARQRGVRDIVFMSSMATYGTGERKLPEHAEQLPENAYGWSKLLAERIYLAWHGENPGNKLVICRPAVIFGPGEGANFTRLARMMRMGYFVFPGRRDTVKACYYVKDLVSALISAAKFDCRMVIFNGCYDHSYSIEAIIEAFRKVGFIKVRTVTMPEWLLVAAAALLKPVNLLGLGVHPDRIRKLTRSTNLEPAWLRENGLAKGDALATALMDWKQDTSGRMD